MLPLTQRQFNKFNKHLKNNTWVRIEFSYDQLKEIKNGVLLKEMLDLGNKIPVVKSIVPCVKDAAPDAKKMLFQLIVRNILDWLDKELSNVQDQVLMRIH